MLRLNKRVPKVVQERVAIIEKNLGPVSLRYLGGGAVTQMTCQVPARMCVLDNGKERISEEALVLIGEAMLSPKDSFVKAKGTQVAFNRLVHALSDFYGRPFIKRLFEGSADD